MPSYVTPVKNSAFIMYLGLPSQATPTTYRASPTLAAGDFKVSIDGGTLNNLTTLPTVTPAAGKMVKISLSATEMNGDNITVVCSDAAGAEWSDVIVNIQTTVRQIDDLAFPTTSGRGIAVDTLNQVSVGALAAGVITAASIANSAITNAKLAGGAIDSGTLATGAITAGKFAAGAIDAAAIATDAIGAAELATDAVQEIADALLDRASAVDTYTPRQALRLLLAGGAGKVSISGATVTIRAADDSKDRISATTDSTGQRTAVTLTAT